MKLLSPEIESFLLSHYKEYKTADLTDLINKQFGTKYTPLQIRFYKKNHRLSSGIKTTFKKGHISSNKGKHFQTEGSKKTQFKKGIRAHNTADVGSENQTSDGYLKVKIADPNIWKFKHVLVWEKEYGSIPKGHVITFLDGNHKNCDITNLALITRGTHAVLTAFKLRSAEAELTKTGIIIAQLVQAKRERITREKERTKK